MRIVRSALSLSAALIILFLGCQHAAIAYRLRHDGLDPILLPPTAGNQVAESFAIAIRHARRRIPKAGDCDIEGQLLALHWEKSTADISFNSQSFFVAGPNQVGRGIYLDPLLAIETFRSDLTARQSKGCLSAAESEGLLRAMVENLPLPPPIAYFLQLGSYEVTGYLDLTPDFRMQVSHPIYAPGAAPSVATMLGYETANYSFIREGSENRVRLQLGSASEVLNSGESFEKQTLRNELAFSKFAGYFRLLFMAEESASDPITRAILLSASDQDKLGQPIPQRGMSPDQFCTAVSTSQVNCTVFPKNFGVSPELRIRVNGKDAFLRVGGTVSEALSLQHDAGPPASLRILRPFHGRLIPIKFDRSKRDILGLILLPGDQITF